MVLVCRKTVDPRIRKRVEEEWNEYLSVEEPSTRESGRGLGRVEGVCVCRITVDPRIRKRVWRKEQRWNLPSTRESGRGCG
jgi:hypothetical protein